MNTTRFLLLGLALTAACSGNDDKDGEDTDPPVIVIDDTGDTFTEDTDVDLAWDSATDTGVVFMTLVEGRAEVTAGVSFDGWTAAVSRWVKPPLPGYRGAKTGCAYISRTLDWASDPFREGQNDPLAASPTCDNCTFQFTVSVTGMEEAIAPPWAEVEVDTDTDVPVDTDTGDTAAPDVPDGMPLINCEALRRYELVDEVDPDFDDWIGVAFDPSLYEPDDPTTGAWMTWDPINAAWVPYNYGATYADGVFEWSAVQGQYFLY